MSLSEKTKVEVIQGDITDYSSVLEASRGADAIVHMASLVDVWHRIPESLIHSVNINGEADDQHLGGRGNTNVRALSSGKTQTGGNELQLWRIFKDFDQLVI